MIIHGRKDKICSSYLAEQIESGIAGSHIVANEINGHSLFVEETKKFNGERIAFTGI